VTCDDGTLFLCSMPVGWTEKWKAHSQVDLFVYRLPVTCIIGYSFAGGPDRLPPDICPNGVVAALVAVIADIAIENVSQDPIGVQ
jgi:hypothetical protein